MSKTYKHQDYYDFIHHKELPIKKIKKWQKFVDWVNFGNYKNMENSRWLKHKHRNKDRYELDEYDD